MVDAVGHHLGLQTEGGLGALGVATLEGEQGVLQEVGGIELDAGLVGVHLHFATRNGIVGDSTKEDLPTRAAVFPACEVEAMVEASGKVEILTICEKVLSDRLGHAEIEGGSLHGLDGGGNEILVPRHVGLRIQPQGLLENTSRRTARQVEVCVVGQVDGGRLIGGGLIAEGQGVFIVQGIGDLDPQIPREALLTVGGDIGQGQNGSIGGGGGFGAPDHVGIALLSAVKAGGAVIGKEGVGLAVQLKGRICDAVGHTTHQGPQIPVGLLVVGHGIVAKAYVRDLAVFIGGLDADDGTAEIGDLHGHILIVDKGIECGGLAVGKLAPGAGVDVHTDTSVF